MNVRMYIPSGHALQGPLVDRGGVFIGWIDYSGPCKPLWWVTLSLLLYLLLLL